MGTGLLWQPVLLSTAADFVPQQGHEALNELLNGFLFGRPKGMKNCIV
jgi:hypothetical protein